MNRELIVTITLLFVLFMLIIFYAVRLILSFHKRKREARGKESGHVGFVIDTFHDLVSQLKDKERELQELKGRAEAKASSSELYTENIFQSVPSGVVSFDRDFRITKMNSAAQRILDLGKEDVIGKRHTELFSSPITGIIEAERSVEREEISYTTKSGKRVRLGLTSSPLMDGAHNAIGQILVFTDITELKAFQSQKELRETLSTLGEMSAGIAHELRNPMGVISGYTKMLSKKVDRSMLPSVEAISKEISVMNRIITDFLSFARHTEPEQASIDLPELIQGCIHALAEGTHNVRVVFEPFSDCVVRGDEVLLRQSITNLIQNALEAMPDGGTLTIRITLGDTLAIVISDTGYGIPGEIRDKIFLPFFTTKERGTGLGLSIVHKNVVSQGGNIEVSSSDSGTSFEIRLPKSVLASVGKKQE